MKISVSYNPSYYLLLTILLNRSEVVLNIQVVNLFVQKKKKKEKKKQIEGDKI